MFLAEIISLFLHAKIKLMPKLTLTFHFKFNQFLVQIKLRKLRKSLGKLELAKKVIIINKKEKRTYCSNIC